MLKNKSVRTPFVLSYFIWHPCLKAYLVINYVKTMTIFINFYKVKYSSNLPINIRESNAYLKLILNYEI